MVAQGKYAVVKGDISSDSPSSLQSVKNLATYLHKKMDRADVLAKIKTMQEDGISMNNPTVALMSATVLFYEQQPDEALRCLHGVESIDTIAFGIQILLSMNRVDVARKELKKLQALDEDATVTQLALAWVSLANVRLVGSLRDFARGRVSLLPHPPSGLAGSVSQRAIKRSGSWSLIPLLGTRSHITSLHCPARFSQGGEKLQEAFYIFQELGEKYGATTLLLNGQAAALIQQGKHDEADSALQSALEKDSNNAETLINCISVAQATGKPQEVVTRYLNQLQDSAADHPFVKSMAAAEADFDSFAAKYSVGK